MTWPIGTMVVGISSWVRFLRPFVPLAPRRWMASQKRSWGDRASAVIFASDIKSASANITTVIAQVSQPLIVAPHLDEKRANLAKAIGLMNGLIIKPGQTLSLWHCLGSPTAAKGWASGRTIINDVMTTDPGGGLCQFSSLIYHLGLLAGLRVIERHHHSRDIHTTDATRFTALGLDATIVYGFKDLRLANDGGCDVTLDFELTPTTLSGRILAAISRPRRVLHLERHDEAHERTVVVSYVEAGDVLAVISRDRYQV